MLLVSCFGLCLQNSWGVFPLHCCEEVLQWRAASSTQHFLKVADCYRLDPKNLALWDDVMQLEKILKY